MLGVADTFRTFANHELEVTLVELEQDGEKHVLLVRPDITGNPLIEDMGASLAVAVGRAPWAGIEGLSFDYAQFAESGQVDIVPVASNTAAERGMAQSPGVTAAPVEPVAVSIGQHLAQDEARQAAAAAH